MLWTILTTLIGGTVIGLLGKAVAPGDRDNVPLWLVIICGMVGIPPEGIGMIFGVDRFLDMCRTVLNVTGDLAAAVVVSRGEEHIPETESPIRL